MASCKAEFMSDAEASAVPAVPSSTTANAPAAVSASGLSPGSISPAAAQTRKSPRSRTTTLFSSTLLRQRGKSVSRPRVDDWGRPVGGSEGLGCIYNSSMDSRERSQVLRSVTQLSKESTNDLVGAAAEAFSSNATAGLSQSTRFFANLRRGSSNNVANDAEAPPSYQQHSQLEGRRRSEGSIFSQISSPCREIASPSSSASSSRPSLQISRPSFFSSGATSSASASASTSTISVSGSPLPRQSTSQQSQQSDARPKWTQRRRSSNQFTATARQALLSSRSFFGRSYGVSEDQPEAISTVSTGFSDGGLSVQQMPLESVADVPTTDEQASRTTEATVLDGPSNLDSRQYHSKQASRPADPLLHSRKIHIPAGQGGGDTRTLKADSSAASATAKKSTAESNFRSQSHAESPSHASQQPKASSSFSSSPVLTSSLSLLDPSIAVVTALSTAPSTPLNSTDSPAVFVVDDVVAAASSSFSPVSPFASLPPTTPSRTASSRSEAGEAFSVAPTLSTASSTSNIITTQTLTSTPNTTQASTAATTPSHSTPALASPALPSSQHASLPFDGSLNIQIPATQSESIKSSAGAAEAIDVTRTPPLTPPSSSGACTSPRSSTGGALAHTHTSQRARVSPPSPPASSAHRNSSVSSSRRGSSDEPAPSSINPLSPRSSVAVDTIRPEPTSSSTSSSRVSFDLRRIAPFGGFSTASKMSSSKVTRASFSGMGNGPSPNAANTDSIRHASSPSGGVSSKFFSRISLPGGSRRGSTNESPASSPEARSRSRFSSFGKIGRGSEHQTSPNGGRDLRKSMQPWASASTDVLGTGPAQTHGRNSLALAREEAIRPRKSLHLPRANLIDLDAEETSDTATSTSTAVRTSDTMALPPIPTAFIKADKSVSPSAQSAPRTSFNFLRRASATSNHSAADNVNGERRGSFARTFMGRTWSRNSKGDVPQDAANSEATPHAEAEPPAFRSGVFESRAPVAPGSVTYPGMSSTVDWNAPTTAQNATRDEIAPNDVDPIGSGTPAYPDAAVAVNGTAPQPRSVTDVASGVLAERRPSQGIDQEQDAVEATDSITDAPAPRGATLSTTGSATASPNSNVARQRTTRSNHALSHLPRLDSMRAIPSASGSGQEGADGTRTSRTGSESTQDSTMTRDTSDEEQELSEEEDEGDLTSQTSDYHDIDDTETDDDTDYDGSPVASRMSAAPMAATGSFGGIHRNRPTESLILPPAPTFIPNTRTSHVSRGSETAASTTSEVQVQSDGFSQNVGRDSWTSFSASGFTPFETPTPRLGGFNFSGPTPRARQEVSESSYFTARPGTSNSNRASTVGSMSGDAPPPSPSIISRSRAPSSASMRTIRTPGAGAVGSGPVPNRSMPAPVAALPPLTLHRQLSKVVVDRSKSPAQTPVSSRPSTSGTLTPLQAPAGEVGRSRAPSIDRPASERFAARPGQGEEVKVTPSPKPVLKPLVGLDGISTSAARPNFYQQKSKSLVDLLGPASRRLEIAPSSPIRPVNEPAGIEALRTPTTPRPPSEAPTYSKKDGLAPIDTSLSAAASIASPGAATLGRRRSMFEMRAEPPVYSIIHNRPEGRQIILPREEEGREKLPAYCCGVHIEGYLPRKLEFSAPGVQAKDRSWKRQYFVLHGTSLRVYKNDLSVDRLAANGSWGEMKGVHVHLEPMNEDGSNGSGSGIGLGAAAREAISHTPLGFHRHDASKHKEASTQFDNRNGLIRNYTLQGAESGLAADYLKRRHVVRVRAEGEQFLLQTRSDRHVVDWIEALQAATNVSVDLEKRAMPKFITLPRRRRRRRRNADGATVNAEEQEARDLAEAQRRSMAEAGGRAANGTRGGGSVSEATPRDSISQRPSMSLENELNPSAAFERMLREDQEEGGRQSAAVI
ncbi:hypothetical protein EX895_005911 [Sporisorium graminicola]|uniref:PH domain-containing protein n=1 Tax=Sporisorium graminicola TaxID=280036 RepID=A0A4U7KKY9_9BASI|nr:hypothetical protein EX895_005911 [Sporisorium graminicola]TKY84831.1 hypothetical protein EX895_005911 [Sporisorium graminicola]